MPVDISQDIDDSATAIVSWEEPYATDNSGYQMLTSSHSSETSFPLGVTSVEYMSVDPAGNSAKATFDIDIRGKTRF